MADLHLPLRRGEGPARLGAPTLIGGEEGIRVHWYPLRTVSGRRSEGEVLPHRHAVGRVLERAGAGKHRGGRKVGCKKRGFGGVKGSFLNYLEDGDASWYGLLEVRGGGVRLASHGLNDSTFSSSYQGGVGSTQLLFYPSWPIF